LVHKLPRIGRKRFHIAPLPLGKNRIERQRRLPRPRHAGEDDQLVLRQRQLDVFEVVDFGAGDGDGVEH
jgi:hypothetical protein